MVMYAIIDDQYLTTCSQVAVNKLPFFILLVWPPAVDQCLISFSILKLRNEHLLLFYCPSVIWLIKLNM